MNIKNYHLGHEALQRFENYTGIKANWTPTAGESNFMDGKIVIYDPRFTDVFAAEFKNEVRNHHLPALLELKEQNTRPYILIAQTIFPSVKEYLRKNNINYIVILPVTPAYKHSRH
jgi:hypothetical protein